MASVNSLEREQKEILLNMKSDEIKAYQRLLVKDLYKNFIENPNDTDELLKSKRRIEGNTEILSSKYGNALEIELGLRLEEANRNLIQILEQDHKLSEYFIERIHDENILTFKICIKIMEALLNYNEGTEEDIVSVLKDISKDMKKGLDHILFYINLIESDLDSFESEDYVVKELIRYGNTFKKLNNQIDKL